MMCRCLKVSRSGYYAWLGREPSRTVRRRKELSALIEWVFNSSHGTYGYRRVHAALARRGVETSPDTVRSIMRSQGLEAAQPRRKVRTTVPAADLGSRPDLVRRNFTASQPGVKWVGDITYIRTWEGFVYLATVLDCCTKKAVGYAMADNMRTDLICEAIDMAARRCPYTRGETIFHSDRGCQYTSEQLSQHLGRYEIIASTGRTGVCWAGAWAEVGGRHPSRNERVYQMVHHRKKQDRSGYLLPGRARHTSQTQSHPASVHRTQDEADQKHRATRQTARDTPFKTARDTLGSPSPAGNLADSLPSAKTPQPIEQIYL